MKRTPLKRKTPLKSYTPLRAYKGLNKVSEKQAKENAEWSKVKAERIDKLIDKFGYLLCELCKRKIERFEAEGHHNSHDRRDNTPKNCRITCHICNCYTIEDEHIKDVPSLL